MSHKIKPIHPGKILHEEFLRPLKISQYRLAIDVHVPPRRINEIIHGERGISANTALRLAKYFGNSAEFWFNLQTRYELLTEEQAMESELKNHVLVLQS